MGCAASTVRRTGSQPRDAKPAPESTSGLSPAETPHDVLRFWYRGAYPENIHLLNDSDYMMGNIPRWMLAQQNMDEEAKTVVSNLIRKLGKGEFKDEAEKTLWWDSNEGLIAQILCLDQLSRNCFRGQAEAYAYDDVTQTIVTKMLETVNGDETQLLDRFPAGDCLWIAISMQHTEDLALHEKESRIYDAMDAKYPSLNKLTAESRKHGKKHTEVLERFGRYPHRNNQLSRQSTDEEKKWLADIDNLPVWAKGQVLAEGEFRKQMTEKLEE